MAEHKPDHRSDTVLTWRDIALAALMALLLTAFAQSLTPKSSSESKSHPPGSDRSGFTLLEMSIVLVIIGLIVGGVLVGQELIRAAYVRAQISQIEKFNAAVNTFYGKFQALPGDMNYSTASGNGFATIDSLGNWRGYRGAGAALCEGAGDGNGQIESNYICGAEMWQCMGEPFMFWSDLTFANGMNLGLVEGSFGSGSLAVTFEGKAPGYNAMLNALTSIQTASQCMPLAKIGGGNFVYVYSTGGINYYGLSPFQVPLPAGLTVAQAYRIDGKMDDGLPTSGNVQAIAVDLSSPALGTVAQSPSAPLGSYTSQTCFDSVSMAYAMASARGNAVACNLSFKFQ